MELIRGAHNLQPQHRGCVATIGNFDGVHLGHQAILAQLRSEAEARNLPSVVITFEPLPHEFFRGTSAPARLTGLRERLRQFALHGIDRVLLLRFDRQLADLEANHFVERLLVGGLGIRAMLVGDDFRFGRDRAGDFASLRQAGEDHVFEVIRRETYELGGERVSSTRIRHALAAGDLEHARELLGRPYTLSGRVRHGDARGRTIGFPTANIALPTGTSPLRGVFAVTVTSEEGLNGRGVANIGTRPTVDGRHALLEVHLLGFEGNLYHQHLCVSLQRKIRDEQRFDSLDALVHQIRRDASLAEALLAQPT
ncbi:bifunctional riboflavin kinase/FAD synthetase [Acidihalobacter prosperus]|uniref:Riboflavin biosynthesis protein n=1 Tax=Acidihalobacter prosperus TaxID=160660 RepID=A0A1A6C4L2_9GAMM|nr:bifunctional riboflavin kinase/FAD synthetase [Acidihalobacter prosperus]OBS09498.1 bifunctional riboflavin kinase/FMN adenylyltransferase [Acidihalobacter prosperus]